MRQSKCNDSDICAGARSRRSPGNPRCGDAAAMSDDQIDSYIDLKMEEVLRFETHPHPVEFDMYYKV